MDINKLNKGQELLVKSQATSDVINVLKNLDETCNLSNEDTEKFRKGLYVIKQDFYMKLLELKAQYDKEFDIL